MKKLFVLILTFVLAVSMTVLPAVAAPGSSVTEEGKTGINSEGLQKLSGGNAKELSVSWNEEKGIPRFISGKLSGQAIKSTENALSFMDENKELFKVKNSKFMLKSTNKDELGMLHYRMGITSDGIPVYGRELILHSDGNGSIYAINGDAAADVPEKAWKKEIKLSEQKAIEIAEASLDFTPDKNTFTADPQAELYINDFDGVWQPVYLVKLQFINPYPADMRIFINASDGKIVQKNNEVKYTAVTATGTGWYSGTGSLNVDYISGIYYTRDLTRSTPIYTYTAGGSTSTTTYRFVTDTDGNFNATNQMAGVDAHRYMGKIYDYFKMKFGRNSYDNGGAICKSVVNYGRYSNQAFWNGSMLFLGDGDGVEFGPLCALDVMAHEYTHAIIQYTANLTYSGQSGALNESLADCFACFVEGTDWLIGEDCYTPAVAGDAITSVANPPLYGSADHMKDYVVTANTLSDLNINKGIPSKACYNIACSLGMQKTAMIYYRALNVYMMSNSQFVDARDCIKQAAADLYGASSVEYNVIEPAFTSVGIGTTIIPPVTRFEPNDTMTAAYGPLAGRADYQAYIGSSTDVDYYYFDLDYAGPIWVALEALPADYDVYLYDSTGTLLAYSSSSGTVNEAISYSNAPVGRYYVKVVGYASSYSTSGTYTLRVTYY